MERVDKVMGFDHEAVDSVRDGTKFYTFRFGMKYDFLNVGDIVKLNDSQSEEVFALAEITSKVKIRFGDLPIDIEGHEKFSSKAEQKRALQKYANHTIKDSSKGLLIGYKLIETYE